MRNKVILLIFLSLISFMGNAQNVGIGVPFASEMLQVDGGNVKIGSSVWLSSANDRALLFGDASYVLLGEIGRDDRMQFNANEFLFNATDGAGYVGINTTGAPTTNLEVNGTVKITDGTQAANKVLTSDAAGVASWKTLTPVPGAVAFRLTTNFGGVDGNLPGGAVLVDYSTKDYDISNNTSGNTFVAPATGIYHLEANLTFYTDGPDNVGIHSMAIFIMHGFLTLGVTERENSRLPYEAYTTLLVKGNYHLNANDIIHINYYSTSGGKPPPDSGPAVFYNIYGSFSGYRIN